MVTIRTKEATPADLNKAIAEVRAIGDAMQARITLVQLLIRSLIRELASERPDFLERLTKGIEGIPEGARNVLLREIRKAGEKGER